MSKISFIADRNAVQRTDPLAVGFFAIECAGLRQRMLGIDMDESVDLAVRLRNSSKTGGRKFLGGNRTVRDFVSRLQLPSVR